MDKIQLAVLFGSRAAEHDVSIVSGLQLIENVDKQKYDPYPVYISRDGEWFIGKPLLNISIYNEFNKELKGLTRVYLPPIPSVNGLYPIQTGSKFFHKPINIIKMDCAILAFHGMHGEDGTIQGLFELCDIPYSSVGVTGSGVGMDKIIMKAVFKSMGLPVLEGKYFYRSQWKENPEQVLDDMEQMGYPLYVKPANLGSSIGIGRAADKKTLQSAIEVAASYDRRILVEKGIERPLEINCAGLGYGAYCLPSVCEQPAALEEFLTFEDKYTRNAKSKGMQSLARKIPAPISEEMSKRIQDMTVAIFKMLECKGVVRIDFIIDKNDNTLYVNEINTIPGSFAFYLFEPMNIKYTDLIDKLVEYAFCAYNEKKESVFSYSSELLQKVVLGGKGQKNNKLRIKQ